MQWKFVSVNYAWPTNVYPNSSKMTSYKYEAIKVAFVAEYVIHVELNRPEKLNAFSTQLWTEMSAAFKQLKLDENVRTVILSGAGKLFTAGLDLTENLVKQYDDVSRTAYHMRTHLLDFQDAISAIENCNKPVIVVVHGGCFGAGVDTITACDIRYCTKDAFFTVKEVDIGLAADIGTLQRLPKVMGNDSLVRELCFTGRNLYAPEALQFGLVNKVFENKDAAMAEAISVAKNIASKSPVAIFGTKHILNYSRDHSVAEGLLYTAAWNQGMLQSEDIMKAMQAFATKKPAIFSKL